MPEESNKLGTCSAITDENRNLREAWIMFLILWNVLGGVLLISTLCLLIGLIRGGKPEQVKLLPMDSRKSSYEQRKIS